MTHGTTTEFEGAAGGLIFRPFQSNQSLTHQHYTTLFLQIQEIMDLVWWLSMLVAKPSLSFLKCYGYAWWLFNHVDHYPLGHIMVHFTTGNSSWLITRTKWIRCSSRFTLEWDMMFLSISWFLLTCSETSCNGFSGAIELEMETPFHRTDNLANNGGAPRHLTTVSHQHRELYGDWRQRPNRVINQRNPTLGGYYLENRSMG